jgi:O-antigen ligase
MSRRNPKLRPDDRAAVAVADPVDSDDEAARWLGERLRRAALGATAALIVSRAFWPGEPDYRVDAGSGISWVLALLIVAGVALAAPLVGGTFRFRWSWADLAVAALVSLVAVSALHAVDRRPALNQAWEWLAIGIAYLLVRNLPRTRGESVALAGALAATAAAVAFYGLYWVSVELPEVQRRYLANPAAALAVVGIQPGTAGQKIFESRLLGSNEPPSTFALANSLAGFLVGPLVVVLAIAWDNLTRRAGRGSRAAALALAALPTLAVLVCLVLTKSRSAYIGLFAALTVLAWRERRRVRTRTLILAAAGAVVVVGALAAAGLATGRLDRLVFTESSKSLRFRREYWVGSWRAINESPQVFWSGFGPGNFAAPYIRHKLPQASEDIHDPHDFVLEVWAAGGLRAVLALAAAVVLALWFLLGLGAVNDDDGRSDAQAPRSADPGAAPKRPGWSVAAAALGWIAALWPIGRLDFFASFERWMILGASWGLAVVCGHWLWSRRPLAPAALGAAALAILVNLIVQAGIGVPAVALMLWSLLALGLNLRVTRGSGRLREGGGRLAAFAAAAAGAALAGTFYGTESPHFRLEAAMAEAEAALDPRHTDFDRALAALDRATDADRFSARPWLKMAAVEYEAWMFRGGKASDLRWKQVPIALYMAVKPPRPSDSWTVHHQRAQWTGLILKQIGGDLNPREVLTYRANITEASRAAVLLNPTYAALRAALAEASADTGMYPDALDEGLEALRLDALTPHDDRKLDPAVRQWLDGRIPEWKKTVDEAKAVVEPKRKPAAGVK